MFALKIQCRMFKEPTQVWGKTPTGDGVYRPQWAFYPTLTIEPFLWYKSFRVR